MIILLSCYACEPRKGSEPGVGWRWAQELAAAGHEVHVITRANNQPAIEAADCPAGLHFIYVDLPKLFVRLKQGPRFARLYYAIWQLRAYSVAKAECRLRSPDIVHHLTFGDFRTYIPLVRIKKPFVIGPLGGGERGTIELRRTLPWRARIFELLRLAVIQLAQMNPLTRAMYAQAAMILCKTPETSRVIRGAAAAKIWQFREIGCPPTISRSNLELKSQSPRFHLLFAGRMLYWKGLHLALEAYAVARKSNSDLYLTVVGDGKDRESLQSVARKLQLEDSVCWKRHMPQQELFRLQEGAHVFIFPSLHDSSGNVVMEALAHGLPVLCLNTGGPATLVDGSCGYRVPVEGRNKQEVVEDLAAQIVCWSTHREQWLALAYGAIEKAGKMTWKQTVLQAYEQIASLVSHREEMRLLREHAQEQHIIEGRTT